MYYSTFLYKNIKQITCLTKHPQCCNFRKTVTMKKLTLPEKWEAFNKAHDIVVKNNTILKKCRSFNLMVGESPLWITTFDMLNEEQLSVVHNCNNRDSFEDIHFSKVFLYNQEDGRSLFIKDAPKEACYNVFFNKNGTLVLIQYSGTLVLHKIDKRTFTIHQTITKTGCADFSEIDKVVFSNKKNNLVYKTKDEKLVFMNFHWKKHAPEASITCTPLGGYNEKIDTIVEMRTIEKQRGLPPVVIITFSKGYNSPCDSYLVFVPRDERFWIFAMQSFFGKEIARVIPNRKEKHITLRIIGKDHHTINEVVM